MIQRQTWIQLSDSSSALWLKVFHLYGGFFRRFSIAGEYVKGAVRVIKPQVAFYKGYSAKKFKKGLVRRSLLIRTISVCPRLRSPEFIFKRSAAVLIKKKHIPSSAHLLGPASRLLRNKRVLLLFKCIL